MINAQDIRAVFNEYLDLPISDEDIEEFVKDLDPTNSGSIEYGRLAQE